MTLAVRVRNERTARGWTQEHLAGAAGISSKTVSRIERGGACSAETLQALAGALDLGVRDLLPRDDEGTDSGGTRPNEHPPDATTPDVHVIHDGHALMALVSTAQAHGQSFIGAPEGEAADLIAQLLSCFDLVDAVYDELDAPARFREAQPYTQILKRLTALNWMVLGWRRPVAYGPQQIVLTAVELRFVQYEGEFRRAVEELVSAVERGDADAVSRLKEAHNELATRQATPEAL